MPFVEIMAVAIALAMDAFAVAIASGVALKVVTRRHTFRLAWHFGLFQAVMPIIGWFGGYAVREYFLRFGHWIAFALLLYIGGHMLWEGLHKDEDNACQDPTVGTKLIMLSVATSIDALAVGFTLAMLGLSIWVPAAIIGVVALLFTAAGLHLGKYLGCETRLGQYAEVLGGGVLLAIGCKILWQAL
ncbi:putative Mn2+ efflux pump MntP [Desulfomicrobium macestii]|uniref:Putative manganese efflux pump MntP n=1 Tax=Desulfomicrobium macestii TaxID=90731 RepID=A0ABR9GZI2_9BACT|nr:manganese efflux pump MntP family protein [Desulfomicrobium macestii]MBE1423858.1 putative Mn2+ efflux pump MntP [Desulfomicrobium macestii]